PGHHAARPQGRGPDAEREGLGERRSRMRARHPRKREHLRELLPGSPRPRAAPFRRGLRGAGRDVHRSRAARADRARRPSGQPRLAVRLVSFERGAGPEAGVLAGERIVPASALRAPARARELLATRDRDGLAELADRALEEPDGDSVAPADATLCAPVPDPQKIICIGLNYRDHVRETGQEIPAAPMWFAKFANSLCGSGAPVILPRTHSEYVDYEAELAIVIGRAAHEVSADDAMSHIAAAMPFNDVSARDLQMQNPLWTSGKAIDTFAPCGPALVTRDEIDHIAN